MTTTFATAFAGIHGSTDTGRSNTRLNISAINLPQGAMLIDTAGTWAVRLQSLGAHVAETLFAVLSDQGARATGSEQAVLRRLQAYDESALRDVSLAEDIDHGIAALDALARKLARCRYCEINERALRRALLTQATHLPLFRRLMVG